MNVEKKLITPAKAMELLQSNVRNRSPKQPVVLKYANEMANGRWKEDTYELIKISKSGVILDGQHRLLAVIKSNIPVYFHIAEGLSDEIFDVLDTGSTRNASDVFKINGVANSTATPSIIAFYYSMKNNNVTKGLQVNQKKTNAELLSIYLENQEKWDNITTKSLALYKSFGKILPPTYIGGMIAFLSDINNEDAINFMEQVCTGRNVKNDIINVLRSRLVTEKVSVNKISPATKVAFLIKSWNAFRKNDKIKILKFTPSTDNMPKAV